MPRLVTLLSCSILAVLVAVGCGSATDVRSGSDADGSSDAGGDSTADAGTDSAADAGTDSAADAGGDSTPDASDAGVTEADIVRCEEGDTCIVVPYDHCCGSTRRAINEQHEDEYDAHPEWQSYYEEDCAVMGACASDEHLNNAVCNTDLGICELTE